MSSAWRAYKVKKALLLLVLNLALCCVFWGFFLSQGAEGEMVFPTEETPFKSDNTTELFNSGQHLPHLPLPCAGDFSARLFGAC